MIISQAILVAFLVSLSVACVTLGAVLVVLRRHRRQMHRTISGFAEQNVTMARKLTEIMLSQQKKQEVHEDALEKMVGYAIKMKKEINLLAVRVADDDEDDYAPRTADRAKQRLH